jgi:hypothetical protein
MSKRPPKVACPSCGQLMQLAEEDALFICRCGGRANREMADRLELIVDDRIESPEDAVKRLAHIEAKADHVSLNDFDRRLLALYIDIAKEHAWLQVAAGDAWPRSAPVQPA